MMFGRGALGIALPDEARMGGYADAAMVNVDLGRVLVERHRLADEALGGGVPTMSMRT